MKTEELKQKAEDYVNDKADKGNYDYAVGQYIFFGKSALEKAYIAGATENGIQWHDLRKDPSDLPNTDRFVYVQTINDTGKAYYDDGWYSGQINGIVIAWCELSQIQFKG